MQTDLYYILFYNEHKNNKLGISPDLWLHLGDRAVANSNIFNNLHLAHNFNLFEAKKTINELKAEDPDATYIYLLIPATSTPIQIIE